MYGLQDWAAVQRVYKQTQSKRKTANILGISRNTVKKLLKLKEEPKGVNKRVNKLRGTKLLQVYSYIIIFQILEK